MAFGSALVVPVLANNLWGLAGRASDPASEYTSTPRGPLAVPTRATAQDLLLCLWLDRHFSFSVSGYLMWLGHISPPQNSLFVPHPALPSRPLHQPATASSSLLTVCKLGFDKHDDEVGIFGRLQRAGLESGMFPTTPASSGRASVTLPWGGDVPAGRLGEPERVGELQAFPSLQKAPRKAEPETFIITTTGERLSFGCAGPTKTILFMCFQALKNSFRAHQWGVNRNFEMRKMPAGYVEPQPASSELCVVSW